LGVLALKVVLMRPISGRCWAAAMNSCATCASSAGVWSARACSMNENPDTEPKPGSAGGLNGSTTASGMCCVAT
jgi:hypothetical protein